MERMFYEVFGLNIYANESEIDEVINEFYYYDREPGFTIEEK